METQSNTGSDWLTVFRTDEGNAWLYDELAEGRLRQGWGAPGTSLVGAGGDRVGKAEWEAAHRAWKDSGDPSPRRFAILRRMLELSCGDTVVMPKMPAWNQFTIARVSGPYRFEIARGHDDFGHIIPVVRDSVRAFAYRANNEAFQVSALFSRANHRPAVSFCGSREHVRAARRLLELPSSLTAKPQRELLGTAMDDAFRAAAKSLAADVEGWNGQVFEDAVRQCFIDQGY